MEIDWLDDEIPADMPFVKAVRKFWIGKTYLVNRCRGRGKRNLGDEIALRYGITSCTVYAYAKFALLCNDRYEIIGEHRRIKHFEVPTDDVVIDAQKRAAVKRNSHKGTLNKAAIKVKCLDYKGMKCSQCGIQYDGSNAAIFDFHHRDPTTKELNIGGSMQTEWETLKNELDKTDLVCSNCHRMIHHGKK